MEGKSGSLQRVTKLDVDFAVIL